jgi:hypothetical protein
MRSQGMAIVAIVLSVTLAACVTAAQPASPGTVPPATAPTATEPTPGATPDPTLAPTPVPVLTPTPATSIAGDLVDVAQVTCGVGAPVLASGRVRAARDGVHFAATGQPGWMLGLEYSTGGDGIALEQDRTVATFKVPPGDVLLSCAVPGGSPAPTTPLRIEDPDGWYQAAEIDQAAGSCATGSTEYGPGTKGTKGDPIGLAKKALRGIRPGDVVQRGGYPADTGIVVVVRDGRVIGRITFQDDSYGGWLLGGSTLCGGLSSG